MRLRLLTVFVLLYAICGNAAAQDVAVFPQLGHFIQIQSVDFSPDGKYILSSGSSDIRLWEVATGREIRTFLVHADQVSSVVFSPDGKQMLSGSWDRTIKLCDIATGREIKTFSGHTDTILSVSFSPDGRQVLSGSHDDTMKLWDVATGREIRTFSGHTGSISSVSFSPDGRQVLSGSSSYSDHTIKLWDTANGKEIRTFSGHIGGTNSVAFSPDGKQVLSGSYDGTIKLWEVATGREIRTLWGRQGEIKPYTDNSNMVWSVSFSPDGKQILTASSILKLWDTATGNEIRTFSGAGIVAACFSPDGKEVVTGHGNGTVCLYDVTTGREIRTFTGNINKLFSTTFSSDRKQFITGHWGTIKLWDAAMGHEIGTFSEHSERIYSLVFSSDGKQMLSGSFDKTAKLWDVATGNEIRTFSGHTEAIMSVSFSPDEKQMLSGSFDNTIKLWDVATGNEIRTFSGHTGGITSVSFSPDGKQILSSSYGSRYDGKDAIKLWDTATGREIRTFLGHTNAVSFATFSPDGKQILSGSYDNTAKLWDVATGQEIRTFSGHTQYVSSVCFSPDGKQFLSCSWDYTIKLWDIATGREIRSFLGHSGWVEYISFSPDGSRIFSGSLDGSVRIWNTATGREIASFISFYDGDWIVVTPDGFYNASPNGDKYLNVRVGNNVYGIDQYRSTFYKPQIVEARLQGKPDPVRITQTIQDATDPPVVVIRSPENGAGLSSNQVELSVSVVDQKQPIRNVKVLVNGRLVGSDEMKGITGSRGLNVQQTGIIITSNENRVDFRFPLTLTSGANRIEVLASNPYSEGRDSIEVNFKQAGTTPQNILPNLWILSIGVNRYTDEQLPNLGYAVNDAKAIIDTFKAQQGKVYRTVNSLLIADGASVAPTRDNIIDNFSFLKQAGQRDVVLLFIAGHGVNDDGDNFHFMPSDAAINADSSIRPSRAISWREIQSVLDVPGQKLVFIDACHSEGTSGKKTRGADNNQLVRSLQDNSTVIFTSSRGNQLSQESKEFGHGIFTYAIIQGLKSEADLIKDGKITMKELDAYVSETVPKLTNGSQHPTTSTPDGYVNFIVAETGK